MEEETRMPYKNKEAQLACQRKHYQNNKEAVKTANKIHRATKKSEWKEYKKTLSCVQCGQNHPATLDFHHVVRSPDNKKIHALIRNGAYAAILEEIKKCAVLCANCHRILHHDEYHDKKKANKKSNKGP